MLQDVRWLPGTAGNDRYFLINQYQLQIGTLDKDLQSTIVKTINFDVAGDKHNDACCFSMEPRRGDHLVAIGHTNGRICVVNPTEDDCVSELRNNFMCDQSRSISKLSWCPTNPAWLFVAQPRYRHNEANVVVYDISRSSRNNRDLSSIYDVYCGDAIDSTWFPGEAGFAVATRRLVRLYDLRTTQRQRPDDLHIEGTTAIAADPWQRNRLCCISRSGIRLFDLRYQKRHMHYYHQNMARNVPPRRFMFHPNRRNNLSVVLKESRQLAEYIPAPNEYYDAVDKCVSPNDFLSNFNYDRHLSYLRRYVPFDRKILSFDWHLQDRDRVLLTFDDKSVAVFDDCQFPDFDFKDGVYAAQTDDELEVTTTGFVLTEPDEKTVTAPEIETVPEDYEIDISEVMMQRVKEGYGIAEGSPKLTDLISQCATVIAADKLAPAELRICWEWIARVVHIDFSADYGMRYNSSFPGALTVLQGLSGNTGSTSFNIDQNKFIRRINIRTMKHPCRDILLKLCGWPPIRKMDDEKNFEDRITYELSLEASTATKAIALAFFTGRSEKAKEYFDHWSRSKDSELHKDFDLVKKYIHLLEDTNSFCETSMDGHSTYHEQISDPYLSAIVLYIQTRVSYQNNLMQVMKITKMPIDDRIAFAAVFMSDIELRRAITQMQEESQTRLDGLLICGLGCHEACHSLLQEYVERTGDIQTVTIILIATDCFFNGGEAVLRGVSSPFHARLAANSSEHGTTSRWIRRSYCCVQDYFQVLNAWGMWINRAYLASLLQARLKVLPPKDTQAVLACSFCGAQAFVAKVDEEEQTKAIIDSFPGRIHQIGDPKKIVPRTMACHKCRKPLPKCALCRYNVGNPLYIEDSQSPISHWFVWCTVCHHGGHLSHVMSWFEEIDICVVPGCECRCQKHGYVHNVNNPELPTTFS
uniref:Zinc_ribbon_16 domain-containing protein n=1 Tax=Steinernema glaseri TaxID=37863 RepID=A0A1I8AHL2_9BILA